MQKQIFSTKSNSTPDTPLSSSTTTIAEPNDTQEQASKWVVLIITAIGIFMTALDSSIVNISLPRIAHDFTVTVPLGGTTEWVIIAYLVASASILLTAGRLADMVGHKLVWTIGLVIFTLGSALCGLAPSLTFLIAARALQGIGGALIMAVSPAMVTSAFPANERGRALGLNAITISLGLSLGPTLGGFITAFFTWRWIFYVNIPIGIIGLIATRYMLTERRSCNAGRFDPWGALLLGIGLACLIAGLSFGQELRWTSLPIITALLISAISLVILPIVESRVANPVIVFSLLKNRVFCSAIVSLVLNFLAISAVGFLLPFYLEQLRSFPLDKAGLLLTPYPITIALLAPFAGTLADHIGSRWLAPIGMVIACIGLFSLSMLRQDSSIWDIVWCLILIGAGQAIFQSPNSRALMGSAPHPLQGSASGFLATGRAFGQCVSIALAGTIFASMGGSAAGLALVTHSLQKDMDIAILQQTFLNSFRVIFLACAAIAAISALTSLIRGKEDKRRHNI